MCIRIQVHPLLVANYFNLSARLLISFHALSIATCGVQVLQLIQYVDSIFLLIKM